MLGHKERDQGELFITGSLRQLLPNDHILVRVDRVLDLSWLRARLPICTALTMAGPGSIRERRSASCWPAFWSAWCMTGA